MSIQAWANNIRATPAFSITRPNFGIGSKRKWLTTMAHSARRPSALLVKAIRFGVLSMDNVATATRTCQSLKRKRVSPHVL
jgi:hypothetical protein